MEMVIGREDEFRMENRNTRKYNYKAIDKEIFNILKQSGVFKKSRRFCSNGKFEKCGYGFEVTTPAIKIEKGCSTKLTESTLAHRMILLDAFFKCMKRSKRSILIYGWSSHENISICPGVCDKVHYVRGLAKLIKSTVVPVLFALYKAKISCYPIYAERKLSWRYPSSILRLQFSTEYIPDPIQLSAANAFLIGSVRKLELLLKEFQAERGNSFFDFYRCPIYDRLGLQIRLSSENKTDIYALPTELKEIQQNGLKSKVKVINKNKRNRQVTLEYVFKHWLDVFHEEISKYATKEELITLEKLARGERKLVLDYSWPPHHYDIDASYFKTFTRDNPVKFFMKNKDIGLRGWK